MTNNFKELKLSFDAECKIAKQMVSGATSNRSAYPVACVIVKLLQGYTARDITGILREVDSILDALKGDTVLDTDKVYQTKVYD